MISTITDGRYVIGVNEKHHVNRRRFSEAHELGHAGIRTVYEFALRYEVSEVAMSFRLVNLGLT